jgi:hypothetical protein
MPPQSQGPTLHLTPQPALHKNPDFSTVFCAGEDSAQKVARTYIPIS